MDRAKTEVEKKVSRLIKFIQNKNKIPKDSKRELLAIVNDLQDQCRSLYSSIDDFQQDFDPKTGGGRRKGKSHIAPSSSDLEYYSSYDIENVVQEGNEVAELESKLEALRNEAEEKERELTSRVKELERELADAKAECDRKGELEEEIAMKASESKQLGEKNKGLRSQISGLELVLKEKGDEISTLVNKFGNSELGLTSRIEDLKSQLRNLEQEIGFLRARNTELAGSFEAKRAEEKERVEGLMDQVNGMKHELELLRNQKDEVESKLKKKAEEVTESKMQLKSLKEETEEQMNKLNEEIDSLKGENQKLHSRIAELDSLHKEIETKNADETEEDESKKLNIQVSDQKKQVEEQDEVIQRYSAKIKDQQRLLKEQKDTIDKFSEDLKQSKRWSLGSSRDSKLNPYSLERKMEELAEDFRMKIEDRIRILYRRIHVAEQIHVESKKEYIKARDMDLENTEKRESLIFFETHLKKIKDVWEEGYTKSMKNLRESEKQMSRVTKSTKEIDSVRLWVREKNNELETLSAKLECKEAQESLLKEKLSKLEKKLGEEGTEKLNLAKVLSKFEARIKELEINVKRREVALLSLGEEKREAIRQLCFLVDYQRDRFDEFKKSVLKISLKT